MSEADVLAANERFYTAFKNRSALAMDAIWSTERAVSCIHPNWAPLAGREAVLASWFAILGSTETPQVAFVEPRALIRDGMAVVLCIEQVGAAILAATNVFILEFGEWRLLHHHASPIMGLPTSETVAKEMLN